MVLRERIELSTSPLPRVCSTTELPQRPEAGRWPADVWAFRQWPGRAQEGIGNNSRQPPEPRGAAGRRRIAAVTGGMTDRKKDGTAAKDEKAARRAQALRENLLRRKAQARARADKPADEDQAGSDTGEGRS
jgi:hypothetical protein